jgi:predicted PurR-regulated permease PerM
VHHVIQVAHRRSARFIGLMALRAAFWFVFTLVVAELADLRVPTTLAALVAVLSFIPRFGLVVAALPVAVVAALRAPDLVVPVLVIGVVLQAVDAAHVQRRIEERSVAVGSLAMLVFAIIGWSLEGTWGLMLGLAAAAFVAAAVDEGLAIRDGEVVDPGPVDLGPLPPLTPPQGPPPGAAEPAVADADGPSGSGDVGAPGGQPGLQPVPPLP